ncbi:VWA domain-containing protein [Microbulbifer sp. HZ11]|uniref:VWA domain-containing protein n=1 Tax=Microbulbifer sp. HZ11 TaxID=1453501 RepID=UPI001E5F688D|nr:VWA domain-containing protein [Microbulbifer sp. HZ11]
MSGLASGLMFSAPWALLLLPLPLLVWWLAPPHRERIAAIRVPFFQRISERLGLIRGSGSVVRKRRYWQWIIGTLVWLLLVAALARPELEGDAVTLQKPARDLILAVDISGSMDQQDFLSPAGERTQRLAGVKSVLAQFLGGREGERVALIVFGSKAFVQAPLTTDLDTVQELLQLTEVGMAGPHTALGDAIGLAIRQFETSDIQQRLLILLSDGSDTASRMSPINAAAIAAQQRVKILTVGVGDPHGESDNRLDIDTMTAIATRTGGEFFFANDQQALARVYQQIDALAPKKVDSETFRPRQSLAYFPLALALTLAMLSVALHMLERADWRREAAS